MVEKQLEFGGPLGVIFNMLSMPAAVYCLNAACSKETGCGLNGIKGNKIVTGVLTPGVLYIFYLAWQFLLYKLVPGPVITGQPDNRPYKCNGFRCFVITLMMFTMMTTSGMMTVTTLTDELLSHVTTASTLSCFLSLVLYVKSFCALSNKPARSAVSGSAVYDFYMGRELHPRFLGIDVKFVLELRPGLMAWALLDLSYVIEQWQDSGSISSPLLLLVIFHLLYVTDALYFEDTVLTTLDISTERLGFMLVYGNMTWVPFFFTVSTRFLAYSSHPELPWPILLTIVVLNGFGYWIFRSSNNEKDHFRRQSKSWTCTDKRVLVSCDGKRLLADGWWSVSRHPNYLGDIIMAFSWSVVTGSGHLLPWLYFIYLVATLLHRSRRDHVKCASNYGETWDKYCHLVPYRIIPGFF